MDLVKDYINIKKNISKNSSHFNITNDIIVPDFKPDIKKVLECYHDILIKDISFDNTKVTIVGAINYTLIYYSANFELNSIDHTAKFSHEISLSNIPENSVFDATINIENSEYELLNEKRIILKHIAVVSLKHNQQLKIDVISDIQDDDNMEILKENVCLPNYLGQNNEKLFFKENIEIEQNYPPLDQILKHNFNIKKTTYKIVDNKILVSGVFECTILYLPYDSRKNLSSITFEKNLSQVVNMPDISPDAKIDCNIKISDINFNILENSDGEHRIINCEAIFDVGVSAIVPKNITLVSDAYGFSDLVELDKETIYFDNIKDTLSENFYFKNTLNLNSPSADIKIYDVNTKILFSDYKLIDDQIVIDGILNISTLFQDDTDEENFKILDQEYPFKHILDCKIPPNMQSVSFKLTMQNIDYNINIENNLEFKININISAIIFFNDSSSITTNISKTPLDNKNVDNKPSIIVYFVRENDSLWSIAKKYLTTVNHIKITNGLTNDSLTPNQQLLIL